MLRDFTQEDRKFYIERIHRLNSNLHKLVTGASQKAIVRVDVAVHYQRIREQAIILYDSLKEKLKISRCHCKVCAVHLFYHFLLLTRWLAGCEDTSR